MPKFRALELAIEQATQQRDGQARLHAQAIRARDHAKAQLSQLENYATDTDSRWIGGNAINMSVELVKHHYQFMDRLQNAVTMQHGVISNLEQQLGQQQGPGQQPSSSSWARTKTCCSSPCRRISCWTMAC